ncbi:MAG: DUF3383 domain-containing protein [Polyangiaceae bacterium]|nr:DUF3383 domain-containing protein [Polyangiaceae bacterium]
MSLSDVINVTITAATRTPTQKGFGTPLIAGYHTKYGDRVRTYKQLEDLVADTFATTDPIYLAAQKILSQNPRPQQFKVGRRALPFTQIARLTPTVTTEGVVLKVRVGTTLISYTIPGAATIASICAALHALINPLAGVASADNTTHVTVTTDAAGALVDYSDVSEGLELRDMTVDPGIAADLSAIEAADSDWYGLSLDSNSEAEIGAAAAWTETRAKIFVPSTADTRVKVAAETTDVGSDIKTSDYARTGVIWNGQLLGYAGAAWQGAVLPYEPGRATWAFKSLKGVTPDKLTPTELTGLDGKNVNHYTTLAGLPITRKGYAGSGDYLDITIGIDWLTARLQERLYGLLVNNPKVPFTDAGIDLVRGVILGVIKQGKKQGILNPDTTPIIDLPKAADVSAADKAARLLPDVFIQDTLAGAIHKLTIRASLSV